MNAFEEAEQFIGTTEVGSDGVEVECRSLGGLTVEWRRSDNDELHRADGKPSRIDSLGEEVFHENGSVVSGDRPGKRTDTGRLVYFGNGGSLHFNSEGEMAELVIGGGDGGAITVAYFRGNRIDIRKY